MTISISPLAKQQFNQNGVPLAGGKLFTYISGSSTKQLTYSDAGGTHNTNPIILDANGQCDLWLDDSINYTFVLSPSTDTDPPTNPFWTENNIASQNNVKTSLSASSGSSSIGHIAAGAGAVATTVQEVLRRANNHKDYGAVVDGTTNDSAANQASITVLGSTGGTVKAQPGATKNTVGMVTANPVDWVGDGSVASSFNNTAADYAFKFGGTASVYYGGGVRNTRMGLDVSAASGVKLTCTVGALIRDIIFAGSPTLVNGRYGVVIDGQNNSAFFNRIDNVICNHVQYGLYCYTSGAVGATQQVLTNFTATGDVAAYPANGSTGAYFGASCGNGSVFLAGNFEDCNFGIDLATSANSISCFGTRFEGNTTDIRLGLYTVGSSFFGLKNLNNVTDNSGTGYGRHMFWGCVKTDGTPYPNVAHGQSTFVAHTDATVPLTAKAYTLTQTANLQEYQNSSGTVLAAMRANGIPEDITRRLSNDRGDASYTLTVGTDIGYQYFASPLTVNRTLTLSTTGAVNGDVWNVTRAAAATGASTLSVGGLKLLAAGQWCEVVYNVSAGWCLTKFGSL